MARIRNRIRRNDRARREIWDGARLRARLFTRPDGKVRARRVLESGETGSTVGPLFDSIRDARRAIFAALKITADASPRSTKRADRIARRTARKTAKPGPAPDPAPAE